VHDSKIGRQMQRWVILDPFVRGRPLFVFPQLSETGRKFTALLPVAERLVHSGKRLFVMAITSRA
jgi:hypothetical protein